MSLGLAAYQGLAETYFSGFIILIHSNSIRAIRVIFSPLLSLVLLKLISTKNKLEIEVM